MTMRTTKGPKEDGDIVFSGKIELPPLMPEDDYEVEFLKWERVTLFGREKLIMEFHICEHGAWNGQKLFMACNVCKKGSISSKFLRQWVMAAGRRPDRFDRLSLKVFRGKVFRARVRTVRHSYKQTKLTKEQQYSVIDEILEVVVGGKP